MAIEIAMIADYPEIRDQAARIRAENEYRAEIIARKTINVYKDMLH